MTHDAPEHIIEILPRVHPACLARLDQAKEQGCGPRPPLTACEQPVFSSQGQGTDGVLGDVIVGSEAAVLDIAV